MSLVIPWSFPAFHRCVNRSQTASSALLAKNGWAGVLSASVDPMIPLEAGKCGEIGENMIKRILIQFGVILGVLFGSLGMPVVATGPTGPASVQAAGPPMESFAKKKKKKKKKHHKKKHHKKKHHKKKHHKKKKKTAVTQADIHHAAIA
jgi:hypothetical protein